MADRNNRNTMNEGMQNQGERTYDPARFRDRQGKGAANDEAFRMGAEYGSYGRGAAPEAFQRGDDLVFGGRFPQTGLSHPSENRSRAHDSHSGKGPKGYRRSDERIHEEVCHHLERSHHVDASEIEVSVKDGVITLSGSVSDREQKRAAELSIEHLSGVRDVQNFIAVRRT